VFVRNASIGVASVLRSIEPSLRPGDQIVTTAHDYNAIRQMLRFLGDRTGVEIRVARVPFPLESPGQVTQAVLAEVNERTRLVVFDHITSPTGLVFPIDDVISALEPNIPVLVDGAHGPGQVALDLEALGASWYTGNLHKWVCAPKGAGFLHTRQDRRDMTIPTVISHGWNSPVPEESSRYRLLFDWVGTDDFSPWLVVPDALEAVSAAEAGGWPAVMKRNHELALQALYLLSETLQVAPSAPDEMVGSMVAIPLSDASGVDPGGDLSPLMGALVDEGFEVIVMNWPEWPSQLLRVSAHLYNTLDEYEKLGKTLVRLR
jgi:isopenicillin-N epimerase